MATLIRPRIVQFIRILRLCLIAFVAAAGLFFMRSSFGAIAVYVVDIPLAALVAAHVLVAFWQRQRSGDPSRVAAENPFYWQVVLDVLVMGLVVFYTGASSSTFTLLFLIPVILASAFLELRGSLFAASLSTILIAGIFWVDAQGWLADYGTIYFQHPLEFDFSTTGGDTAELLLNFIVPALSLFTAAFISGYLAENQLRIVGEVGELTRRLERIRLNTSDVLENVESGLITVGADGFIIFFNPAARAILRMGEQEPEGRPYSLVLTDRLEPFARIVRQALDGRRMERRNEVAVETDDGRRVPLGVTPSILRGPHGIRGVVLIFQDLTEAKLMEERIRRQDRLAVIGELAAGIAHELRNPLASISGSAEVLLDSLDLEGDDVRLLGLMVKESQRINRIIEDFLNYARLQPSDIHRIDLAALADDVVGLARNHPAHRGNRSIEVDLAGCPAARGDPAQMKQVLLNLLLNALEAMEDGGRVRIVRPGPGEGRPRGAGLVEIWVQDEGPGVPPGEELRIFEPFFTRKPGGTGLGLAVVQRIVEAHDGQIVYAPSRDGLSTFRLYLPVGEET
jgi:two-component system sensor histidine kinase PilS (NtrC family)